VDTLPTSWMEKAIHRPPSSTQTTTAKPNNRLAIGRPSSRIITDPPRRRAIPSGWTDAISSRRGCLGEVRQSALTLA